MVERKGKKQKPVSLKEKIKKSKYTKPLLATALGGAGLVGLGLALKNYDNNKSIPVPGVTVDQRQKELAYDECCEEAVKRLSKIKQKDFENYQMLIKQGKKKIEELTNRLKSLDKAILDEKQQNQKFVKQINDCNKEVKRLSNIEKKLVEDLNKLSSNKK